MTHQAPRLATPNAPTAQLDALPTSSHPLPFPFPIPALPSLVPAPFAALPALLAAVFPPCLTLASVALLGILNPVLRVENKKRRSPTEQPAVMPKRREYRAQGYVVRFAKSALGLMVDSAARNLFDGPLPLAGGAEEARSGVGVAEAILERRDEGERETGSSRSGEFSNYFIPLQHSGSPSFAVRLCGRNRRGRNRRCAFGVIETTSLRLPTTRNHLTNPSASSQESSSISEQLSKIWLHFCSNNEIQRGRGNLGSIDESVRPSMVSLTPISAAVQEHAILADRLLKFLCSLRPARRI